MSEQLLLLYLFQQGLQIIRNGFCIALEVSVYILISCTRQEFLEGRGSVLFLLEPKVSTMVQQRRTQQLTEKGTKPRQRVARFSK